MGATTSWLCVKLTSTISFLLRPTIASLVTKTWNKPKINILGLALNKNTPFWIRIFILSAGPKMGSLDPKDPTIVELEPTRFTDVTSLRPITGLVCTPASIFLEPMLKSCLLNGSSKLDPVKELLWEMTYGLQDFCCIACLRNLEFWLPWTLSPCRVTGMELAHIPTFLLWP